MTIQPRKEIDWKDPILRRFLLKTEIREDGCWDWLGYIRPDGYSYFRHPETNLGHRASWLLMRGTIPTDKEIDHLCRNRSCTNPEHLEPVTHGVNVRRGNSAIWWERCPVMHPGEKPRWGHRRDGRVICLECNRLAEQARRDRAALRAAGVVEIS